LGGTLVVLDSPSQGSYEVEGAGNYYFRNIQGALYADKGDDGSTASVFAEDLALKDHNCVGAARNSYLYVRNITISNCDGVGAVSGGTVLLENAVIEGNRLVGDGGAVHISDATVVLKNATVRDSLGYDFFFDYRGHLVLQNVSIGGDRFGGREDDALIEYQGLAIINVQNQAGTQLQGVVVTATNADGKEITGKTNAQGQAALWLPVRVRDHGASTYTDPHWNVSTPGADPVGIEAQPTEVAAQLTVKDARTGIPGFTSVLLVCALAASAVVARAGAIRKVTFCVMRLRSN
jgi:hypothetical protein